MTDERLYHVDGSLVPAGEATVRVDDRGFRYGDAAFETLRAYGGSIFALNAHLERLEATCASLGMAGAAPSDLSDRIETTLAANELSDAYVRVSVTRGCQPGTLTPRPEVDPTVVVMTKPLPRGGVDGEPVWAGAATVETSAVQRVPDAALPAAAKTHNYLNGILARLDVEADEALLLDAEGRVTEGATSNLFFVDDGTLKTPTTDGPVLPGITRATVLELAAGEAFPVETGRYRVGAVRSADEGFLTNTTWELRPIDALDGEPIGGGPITDLLSRLFDERVEAEHY